MSQDQPKTNKAKDSESKEAVSQISQVAVLNSMLTESEVAAIIKGIDESKNAPNEQVFVRQAVQLGLLTSFQAKLLLARENATLSLGPYVLLDKIGQGGMGSVYKAKHKSMDRIVALKVLRRKAGLTEDSIKRFQQEVMASAKLIHPNIITAFDAGEQNRLHYLVMEYVEGNDLQSLLDREGPLPLSKALSYATQTARGLQYAREKQIIHRDIKPANLLIDNSGCVKILDLGLARIVREESLERAKPLTIDGALMGTVDFLSPEQSLDTKTADVRSDVYSLGCTLYTLLTGEAVFPGGTLVQKILAHRELPPPSVRERRKDVPEALDNLLKKMLAKKPADRPQSMAAIADQLQNILAGDIKTDSEPKVLPSTSDEDAFLETLVFDGKETLAESNQATSPILKSLHSTSAEIPVEQSVNSASTFGLHTQSTFRSKPREFKTNYWKSYGPLAAVAGLALLLLSGFGLSLLFSTKSKQLTLSFDPAQLREISGATIKINSVPKGAIAAGNSKVVIDLEGSENELLIEKKGYTPFNKSFNLADNSSLHIEVMLAKESATSESTPEIITPKPKPSESNKENATNLAQTNEMPATNPPLPSASETPALPQKTPETPPAEVNTKATPDPGSNASNVLIVGVGKDELPDLKTAIAQAKPNDTILIKLRGPLDLSPTDLTGKTPLTIEGAQQDGKNFWPIIRQTVLSQEEFSKKTKEGPSTQALFHGEKLELHFKKLHLASGGYSRDPIECLIRCNSGEISFEECTVTASTDDTSRFAEGVSYPVVRMEGTQSSQLGLHLKRTTIRGARLKSLAKISGNGSLEIEGDQFLWAGGSGNLIELGQNGSRTKLKLISSTIYNITSLLDIPIDHLAGADVSNILDLQLDHSILAAHEKGNSQLAVIRGGEDQSIDNNRWQKLVKLTCSNSVAANFDSWLPSTDKLKTLSDFKTLFQVDKEALTDEYPRFRVYPDGVELQEANAEDFDNAIKRSLKSTKGQNSDESIIGVSSSELPPSLPRIAERLLLNADDASKPRDTPIVIEVNKSNGPIRTLEEAFAKAKGEDVTILITDSETYIPSRNFELDPKPSVLYTESVSHLTIAAKKGQNPKLVISDAPDLQIGELPDFADGVHPPQLFLLGARCQSMHLEGLTFLTDIKRSYPHAVFLTSALNWRMSNCKLSDYSTAAPARYLVFNGYGVFHKTDPTSMSEYCASGAAIYWFENVIIEHPSPAGDIDPQQMQNIPTAFCFLTTGSSTHLLFRNSAIASNLTTIFTRSNPFVEIENCTLLGRLLFADVPLRSIHVENSLIFSASNPVLTNPPGLVDSVNVSGGNNAVWMPSAMITAQNRNQGPLRWMPGPILTRMPILDKNYQLKARQKDLSTMATDGGPVGIRLERFPK